MRLLKANGVLKLPSILRMHCRGTGGEGPAAHPPGIIPRATVPARRRPVGHGYGPTRSQS